MSADNMPPLPGTHPLWQAIFDWGDASLEDGEDPAKAVDAEVHAYARAYAAEQTRELVEASKTSLCVLCALLDANDWHPNMRKDIEFAIEANRALIAKHKGAA